MFERYTERSRRVIFFARYEAAQRGAKTIGTEHLLLALFREDKELMCRLFSDLSLNEIAASLEALPRKEPEPRGGDKALSPESKKVLANAAQEADSLSERHIKPWHLLIGILLENDCVAAQILFKHGVKLEEVRRVIQSKPEVLVAGTSDYPFETRKGWVDYGIPSNYAYPQLVYNASSETLIVEVSSTGKKWAPTRLFYRSKDSPAYTQLGSPEEDVSYESVVSATNCPRIAFNAVKHTKRTDEEGRERIGGNWLAVHLHDLESHETVLTVSAKNLDAVLQGSRLWISDLHHLSPDATRLCLTVALQPQSHVEYFLAELNLQDLSLEKICPLPGIFL